jgi:hypothetical protein
MTKQGATGELKVVAYDPLVKIKYPTKTVSPLIANYPKTVKIALFFNLILIFNKILHLTKFNIIYSHSSNN